MCCGMVLQQHDSHVQLPILALSSKVSCCCEAGDGIVHGTALCRYRISWQVRGATGLAARVTIWL